MRCLPDPLEVKGIPVIKPHIVVSTQLVPDQSLVVLLTKSFGALDGNQNTDPELLIAQIAVTDAIVSVIGPNGVDTLQNLENGFYGGINFVFEEGDQYELKVNSTSLGEVRATSKVLPQVDFDEVMAELSFNGFDDTLVSVTYKALDPIGKNQYMLNVKRVKSDQLLADVLNPEGFMKLETDDEFEGQQFGGSFRAFPRDYQTGDTVAVSLSNISEGYYRFLKLREDNRFSFVAFLGEPVNYPSNVEGGLGYFNLFVPAVRVFVLE
jgi:Domain of unknown function (DUF4249)